MAEAPERRLIRLLIPDRVHTHVVVDEAGAIPSIELGVVSGETTVLTVARDLVPTLGAGVAIVDCYIDQSELSSPLEPATRPVPVLVELEPLDHAASLPRQRWSWASVDDAYVVEPGLQALLDDRLDTWRGKSIADGLRPAWAEAGWLATVSDWITGALAAAGRPAPHAITQVKLWGISTVMRVDHHTGADSQRSWFKAVCPHFGHEPALTQLLADHLGDRVVSVIATDVNRRWMLMDDLGEAVVLSDPRQHRGEFQHLVAIQRWSLERAAALANQGVPRRSLDTLCAEFVDVLADPVCADLIGIDSARAAELAAWLQGAIERVQRLGVPDVLVHGDFHPGNIAAVGDRHVLFDWSDAAIAPAFVDVVTWTWWLDDDPVAADEVWESFATAWSRSGWVDAVTANRDDVQGVAGAYHTVSYAGIVRNLDRHRRPEHAYGLGHFFGLVTSAFAAATRTDPR